MKTRVKSDKEIRAMREGGRILALVLDHVAKHVAQGVSTKRLADVAAAELKSLGGKPAFLGYRGFPDVLCVSVNEEIVHGIPRTNRLLATGDIVSLDFGVLLDGMLTDGAISLIVEHALSSKDTELLADTKKSLEAGIQVVRPNVRVGDIGSAIESILRPKRYGIPRDLVGHGIGSELWEEPNIPNYGRPGTGSVLAAGMTVAIEPMVTLGSSNIVVQGDGWTIRSIDHSRAAHFEHTVLLLDDGVEILTTV